MRFTVSPSMAENTRETKFLLSENSRHLAPSGSAITKTQNVMRDLMCETVDAIGVRRNFRNYKLEEKS
jgi:hypothetical protein